jgi:CheY-like chemotaxis protein
MHTILVVDDNESVLCTMAFVLEQRGYRVRTAPSGMKALEIARSAPVAAALVDVHMPGMDGFQTCTALLTHAHENARVLPVWLMTGGFTREAEKRAVEVGALALLSKPFEILDFVSSLEKRCADPAAQVDAPNPVSASLPTA